jgi:hypothetical protein
MRRAEFHEQEFEGFLYRQLGAADPRLWHPHEVLEQYLGFDRGLFLTRSYLRKVAGARGPLNGFSPYFYYDFWPELADAGVPRSRLPRFRLNCFLQAKRPEFGNRAPNAAKSLGKKRPVYRFSCDSDQQDTLEKVAKKLSKRAVFAYAAPAFHTSAQLFRHGTAGTVVEHSTFPGILDMVGHSRWYYNAPGTTGIRNPDREPVTLSELLRRLLGLADAEAPERSQSEELAELAALIRSALTDVTDDPGVAREAYLVNEWRAIDAFGETSRAPRAVTSYLVVEAFCRYYSLIWFVYAERAT